MLVECPDEPTLPSCDGAMKKPSPQLFELPSILFWHQIAETREVVFADLAFRLRVFKVRTEEVVRIVDPDRAFTISLLKFDGLPRHVNERRADRSFYDRVQIIAHKEEQGIGPFQIQRQFEVQLD
jgi:hypothetical protein